MAQIEKNLPARQETRVRTLGGEDTLETGTATHSGILAWEIPWTKEPDGLESMGSYKKKKKELGVTLLLSHSVVPDSLTP